MTTTIVFDSDGLLGNRQQRTEQWIEALSSGYVRLGADPAPGLQFRGRLKIIRLAEASIGTLEGTVQNITRTAADVAIENTDNVVLLLNQDSHAVAVEQRGRCAECHPGGAVLIEQCEPSAIRVAPSETCNIVALQVPREQIRQYCRQLPDRFVTAFVPSSSALSLTRSYIDFLLDLSASAEASSPFMKLASGHIADFVASIVDLNGVIDREQLRGLHAGRCAMVLRILDRHFIDPDFSLTALAGRLGVTPRYVQMLLAEAETSFIDELTHRRLDRARDMLTSSVYSHKTILDVSQECGFSTVSHFHRVFRRRFAMTPGEMRTAARLQDAMS